MLYTWNGVSIHYLLGMAFIMIITVVMSPSTKYKKVFLNQPTCFKRVLCVHYWARVLNMERYKKEKALSLLPENYCLKCMHRSDLRFLWSSGSSNALEYCILTSNCCWESILHISSIFLVTDVTLVAWNWPFVPLNKQTQLVREEVSSPLLLLPFPSPKPFY